MKTNFHTHHKLCRHAVGTCDDYAKKAIQLGFEELGFSDHAPNDELNRDLRMFYDDFKTYCIDVNNAKTTYKNTLTIYLGIEIEHWYKRTNYYDRFLPYVDYVILGQHYISLNKDDKNVISSFALTTKEEINAYAETLCDAMKINRYDIIAHPELYLNGYREFDEAATAVAHKICKCAEKTNTILEFNANGLRRKKIKTEGKEVSPYPRKEFWDIASQYKIRTILSADAHDPNLLYDGYQKEAEELFNNLAMEKIQFFKEIKK
jgi:histidinol-phosphatase (PHP family)